MKGVRGITETTWYEIRIRRRRSKWVGKFGGRRKMTQNIRYKKTEIEKIMYWYSILMNDLLEKYEVSKN